MERQIARYELEELGGGVSTGQFSAMLVEHENGEWVRHEDVAPLLVEEKFTPTSISSDAIAALRGLVSAIDKYNENPDYVHAPWVRDNEELSRARKMLQQCKKSESRGQRGEED